MSKVSIVMATYNGEKYLREQLESILASSYEDIEIFVFDDGSKDETIDILRDYESRLPNKIHLKQNEKNLGVTKNFLQGLCATSSDYIMFCDQDDVWKPDKIEATLKRMLQLEKKTGKDLPLAVFTDATVTDHKLKVISSSFFKSGHLDPKKTDLAHLLMENKLIGCTIMVNAALRKLLKEHPLPEEARFHDWWVALIGAAFGGISYLNQQTLYYRQHGGNLVGNRNYIDYIKNRIFSLTEQKASLDFLQKQAAEFLKIYGKDLSPEKQKIVFEFSNLRKMSFIKRRTTILKYGFLKTGLVRNIGLMIII
ncbi:MAG TPA: glycosyltransferase family 2 protein [Clostridiales bacterium]|nr:glycosyltransferase family 2 protein [Clostridiales bacterium]